MKSNKFGLIWIAQGYLDAQLKKIYLQSHGIATLLYEESLGTLYGLINTPLGEVEMYTKLEDVEKAKKLLTQLLLVDEGDECD